MRAPVPTSWSYAWLRRFHRPAHTTLVRSRTQRESLAARGFGHLRLWPGAVDTELFRPRGKDALDLPRPIALYMGRVAVEKGLESFLDLDLPGSKVVIGGGPDLERLESEYPAAHFLGPRFGLELARLLSAADVFVFPSRTDTFGLVMLEAMACGVPVAAFPVPGPLDVIRDGSTGAMDEDLAAAVFRALGMDPSACVEFAEMGEDVTLAGSATGPIDARPNALKRCITNLVSNAVKYGVSARIAVSDGDELVLRVADSGPGIPEALLDKVFEPFHRLEDSRHPDTGGTGLGLSIARDIAQAHGGSLVLESPAAGGLVAILTLPRR